MLEIEMRQQNIQADTGHSSKGNQMKWKQDGYWYKADAFGYESLAETVVSHLLKFTGITDYVTYEPVWIICRGRCYRGCRSRNFKGEQEELITLERLHRSFTGQSLVKHLAYMAEPKDRISYTVDMVFNYTGIEDMGSYMANMLGLDAFFLNEDRHTNNIALLYDGIKDIYRCCPFFDMGLSLFSDTRQGYPFEKSLEACRNTIIAKPFSRNFDDQLDAAEDLYGSFLKFDLTKRELLGEVRKLLYCEEISEVYTEEERGRVMEILQYQAGKYLYMLK